MSSVNLTSSMAYTADQLGLDKRALEGMGFNVPPTPGAVPPPKPAARAAEAAEGAAPPPSAPPCPDLAMGRADAIGEVAKTAGSNFAAAGAAAVLVKKAFICGGLLGGFAAYLPVCGGAFYLCGKLVDRTSEHLELGRKLNRAIECAGSYAKFQASVRNHEDMPTWELLRLCATGSQYSDIRRTYKNAPDTGLRAFFDSVFLNENDPRKVLDDLKWARHEVLGEVKDQRWHPSAEKAMQEATLALAVRRLANAEAEKMSYLSRTWSRASNRIASALTFD